MEFFTDQLQKFQTAELEKISSRDETLRKEMSDAQQLVDDIALLMQSPASISVGGREFINRCEQFFLGCIDSGQCEANFSYLDFVPAGRLYVKNEHLGYFRLCDAAPEDVELKLHSGVPAMCRKECTALIETNRISCTNAEPSLDIHLNDDQGCAMPFKTVNNNNGSYGVVFVPSKPGKIQLNVRLFGVSVSSSPLEISVADEVVTPKHMSHPVAANAGSSNSSGLGSSSRRRSDVALDCVRDSPAGGSVKKPAEAATPHMGNFDDGVYFASPPSAKKLSPGSAMPSKQQDSPLPNDHVLSLIHI